MVIRTGGTRVQGLGEPPGDVGGTAGPIYLKAFLIRESKNPFRQAWLEKYVYKCNVVELFTTWWTLKSTKIDKIHKIHAPKIQGRVFSEVAEAPQAATTSRTARGDLKSTQID